jgi:hypothetical protein
MVWLLLDIQIQVLFHSSLEMFFFNFPLQYNSTLSIIKQYLVLEGSSPMFKQNNIPFYFL